MKLFGIILNDRAKSNGGGKAHSINFDTHMAIKKLCKAGLNEPVAEEIVNSIVLGRNYDFSHLVTKEDFYVFKEEMNEFKSEIEKRFNKIETEILLIKQELASVKKEIQQVEDRLRQEIKVQIKESQVVMPDWLKVEEEENNRFVFTLLSFSSFNLTFSLSFAC